STAGAADNELNFVSGHPGRTSRQNTVAHLEYLRDILMPQQLNLIRRREVLLSTYSSRSLENARRARDELFGYQNSRKASLGGLAGLQDPAVMEKKRLEEAELRAKVNRDPQLKMQYGSAWDEIAKSISDLVQFRAEYNLLERGGAFSTELFGIARTLVRMAEEDAKPNAERLREFGQAGRESLEQQLFSEAPIFLDLETVKLADSLGLMMEQLGADHPLVEKALAGESPQRRAAQLIQGSQLADVAARKKLAAAGLAGIRSSDDPMIRLAREVDPRARELRALFERQVEEPQRQAYAKVAAAKFAVLGSTTYPDATFTLRLAFGTVKGYQEGGEAIPPWTTLGGTYDHAAAHGHKEPFTLPESWLARRDRLTAATPFNFVSTADIIGGNSGSPVVNKSGEVVGIIFDGNIHSLVLDYAYTDIQARAVSVHSQAITEALRKIYEAHALADELGK
ncbi:MAG: S46 family peptidase, partial [Pirellulaceae bacterium]